MQLRAEPELRAAAKGSDELVEGPVQFSTEFRVVVIEVRSRSAREPNAATIRWVGYADGTFAVDEADTPLDQPGTEARLHARPDEASWTSWERVELLATRYASLLNVPIILRRQGTTADPVLVSTHPAPWQHPVNEASSWCTSEFGFKALLSIPLAVPAAGMRVVAFIIPSAREGSSRGGDVVYSHGIYFASDNT